MKTNFIKTKRGLTKAILTLLILSFIFGNIGIARADDLADSINTKKSELDSMNSQINDLKNSISAKQKEISSLKNQMDIIDSRVELIQLQIKSTELEMEKTNEEIKNNENEIKQKEADIEKAKESIATVVTEIYMDKNNNALSVIVASSSFSQMIEKTEYLSRIRANLKENIDKLNKLKSELEQQRADLDQKMKDLDQMKEDKTLEESSLEDQRLAKVQIMQSTQGEESAYQAKLAQASAEEQAISNQITALVQEQARRQRAAAVQGRDGREGEQQVVNSGGYVNPLPGLNRVSITGGDYMDPQYGMGFPHTGIDLAAAQGTRVMAVGIGTVIMAYDSGGPGLSYVAIDHGNGIVSKYLHLSAIYVSTGDIVNPGDVIGLSGGAPGSRGAGIFTTGAHLHFELDDYNGNSINPHNYFSFAPPLY